MLIHFTSLIASLAIASGPESCAEGYDRLVAHEHASAIERFDRCIYELERAPGALSTRTRAHYYNSVANYLDAELDRARYHARIALRIPEDRSPLTSGMKNFLRRLLSGAEVSTITYQFSQDESGCNNAPETRDSRRIDELVACRARDQSPVANGRLAHAIPTEAIRERCASLEQEFLGCRPVYCSNNSFVAFRPEHENGPRAYVCEGEDSTASLIAQASRSSVSTPESMREEMDRVFGADTGTTLPPEPPTPNLPIAIEHENPFQ